MTLVRRRLETFRAPLAVPAFRRIWVAAATSEIGDWSARLALGVVVFARTDSAFLTGMVSAAAIVAWLGPGQLLASLADRYPRRRIMITADLVRAVMFALVLLPLPTPGLIAAVFVAGLATPPFQAARSAARPEVLPPHLLGPATALSSITNDFSLIAGYLAGGGLIAAIGAEGALAVNAATFLVSALLLTGIPALQVPAARRTTASRLGAAAKLLWRDDVCRRGIVLACAAGGGAAGVLALVAPYAAQVTEGGAATAATLAATAGVVTIGVTASMRHDGGEGDLLRRSANLAAVGSLLSGGLFVLAPATLSGALAFAALGILLVVIVPANVAITPRLPRALRATSFSLLMGTLMAAQALAAVGAGALTGPLGINGACAAVLLPALGAGLTYLLVPLPRASMHSADRGSAGGGGGAGWPPDRASRAD